MSASASFPRWSSQTKLVVSLLLLALFIYLLHRFRQILAPLVLATILSYILSPAANYFQNRFHVRRSIATLFCYLLVAIVLTIFPIVFLPLLAVQFRDLNIDIQILIGQVENLIAHQYVIAGFQFDGGVIFNQAISSLQVLIEPIFGKTLIFAVDIISSLVWLIIILVISFYLVKDGPVLKEWIENHVPAQYRPIFIELRGEISQIWSAFFRGQLVLAFVVATIFTIIGFIIGLPFSLAMGVFAGFLEFLPTIGHTIWLLTATALAVFLGSTWMPLPNLAFGLLVVGLHIVFQQFDINYLIPRIIGRSVHLPPLAIILGIVSGAVMAGILGISLAAPTIASIRVLGRYIYANLFDLEPFSQDIAPALPPPNLRWWQIGRARAVPPFVKKGK